MRATFAALAAAFALAAGCSADCGPGAAATLTLRNDALTVEIQTAPYGYTVKDASGRVLVATRGAGGGDGYGTLGWTSGKVFYSDIVDPGYFAFDTVLDPWRDQLRVVRASSTADRVDVELDGGAGCVHVSHQLRGAALRVEATLAGAAPPRAWEAAFASPDDEGFLGFGERYNRVDQRGISLYSWPEEGGIAKGEGNPASATNPWPNGQTMTYYPVPFFLSTRGYAFWLDTTWRNQFDLATDKGDAWRAWTVAPSLAYEIYAPIPGDARPVPYQLLDQFTARTGRPMIPPAWSFGPRRRIDRGALVDGVPEPQAMRDHDLALTVVDDTLHFLPNGDDLGHEDELRAWTAASAALGYRTVGYFNPYFSDNATSPMKPEVDRAKANGWLLTNDDGTLSDVWLISGSPLDVYTVDLTNPDAAAWFTGMFQRAFDTGYSGWMFDFGEYVQPTVKTHSGLSGEEFHNQFPVLYQQVAHDALEKVRPGDWYYFARSGYTGSSQYAPMVWSGDPDANFADAEGLPAQMRAGITASLSGVAHWGSDISGFKCLADGNAAADGELTTRWIEAGAMSSNMHDENACSGGGGPKANVWSSPDAQAAWKTYARLHTRMLPYLQALAVEAHATGAPVIRSLWLDFPERRELAAVDDAFRFGPALLAAPVVARGARDKRVTLPPGLFLDWHDQTLVDGGAGGVTVTLPAPLDKLPLLLVDGQLLPLLDPTIDTLADETNPDVIGPADVADVYDVVGLLSAATAHARFTLADGGSLTADYAGGLATPALPLAADEAALASCDGCYLSTTLSPRLTRLRISARAAVDAGGLQVSATGVSRRLRWDLYIVD